MTATRLFAHRQLAELRLEQSPWRRGAASAQVDPRRAQRTTACIALMGLCQAMLGNFRAAISAYRRAIDLAPRNPWYHHNLGHLLDVGLGKCDAALKHLRLAHELEGREDEITASLGPLPRAARPARRSARAGARRGARLAGQQRSPRAARVDRARRARFAQRRPRRVPEARGRIHASSGGLRADTRDPVARLLAEHMPEAGFSHDHLRRAQALWVDFSGRRELRVTKPAVYAAAIEYAIAMVHRCRA